MSLIVQKFGGSSVSDAGKILHAANIAKEAYDAGHDVLVVVSAQGDTTDQLLEKARELAPEPPARELDALLATGEQASAALCATALLSLGVPAVSLSAWQFPLHAAGAHGDASVTSVETGRVEAELRERRVVVAAGFQGVDERNDIATLGRGGSDTSAVALAAALGAERCLIYTDVDGVYTADPRVCPAARRLDAVSYEDMYALAARGAQVLHDKCVALARDKGVVLEVRSCAADSVGTRVTAEAKARTVTSVTRRVNEAGLSEISAVGAALPSLEAEKRALAALDAAGIVVYSAGAGERYLALCVAPGRAAEALCAVHGALV